MAGGVGSGDNTRGTNSSRSPSPSLFRSRSRSPVRKGNQTSQTGNTSEQLIRDTVLGTTTVHDLGLPDDPFSKKNTPSFIMAGMPQLDLPSNPGESFPSVTGIPQYDTNSLRTGSISTEQLTRETTFGPALPDLGLSKDPFTAPELDLHSNLLSGESFPSMVGIPQPDTNFLRTESTSTEELTSETVSELDLSNPPPGQSAPSGSVSQLRPSTGCSRNDPDKVEKNIEEQVRTEQFKGYPPEAQQKALAFLNQRFPDNTATHSRQKQWNDRIYIGEDGKPVTNPRTQRPYTIGQINSKKWRDTVYTGEDGKPVEKPKGGYYTNEQMSARNRRTKVHIGEDGKPVKCKKNGHNLTTTQINSRNWNQRIYIGRDGKTINDEHGNPLTNRQVRHRKEKAKKAKKAQEEAAAAEQTGAQESSSDQE